MSRLDLDEYTDAQVLEAMLKLPTSKFVNVMNGIDQVMKRAQKRGIVLGQQASQREIDDMIDRMGKDDDDQDG